MADHSEGGGPGRRSRAELRRAASRAGRTAKAGFRQARRRAASAGEELRSLQSGLRSELRGHRDLRTGYVETAPLPSGVGTAVDLGASEADVAEEIRRGLDLVTVGPGSPRRISERTLEVLLACEQAGVPMVLIAEESRQLETPTAAVVTHAATPNEDVHRELLDRMGPHRAFLVSSGEAPTAQARRLLRMLRHGAGRG